jgi:hypothetical protein
LIRRIEDAGRDFAFVSRAAENRGTANLAKFFEVSAVFWMTLQWRWDLYHAQQSEVQDLEKIRPHAV